MGVNGSNTTANIAMGVNGSNTTANMSGGNNSGGGRSSGGGNGAGSGGGGSSSSQPPQRIPAALQAEVTRLDFNRAAPKNGQSDWEFQKAKVARHAQRFNDRIVTVASDANTGRSYWMSYGAEGDQKYKSDRPGVTHTSGAIHIHQRHSDDFRRNGVDEKHIISHLNNVIENGRLIHRVESKNGFEELREYNGIAYELGIGANDFIVTAIPLGKMRQL